MYLTHYLTDLAERVIDSGCCFGHTLVRTHVRQRKARQERVRYHAVQHARAAGNIGIVTRPGAGGAGTCPAGSSSGGIRGSRPGISGIRLRRPGASPSWNSGKHSATLWKHPVGSAPSDGPIRPRI